MEIVRRKRIDTTFPVQKAQLSVYTDKCLTEFGRKLRSSSALKGSIEALVNYEKLMQERLMLL